VGLGAIVVGLLFGKFEKWIVAHPESGWRLRGMRIGGLGMHGTYTSGGSSTVAYMLAAIFLVNAFVPLRRWECYVAIALVMLTVPYVVNHLSDESRSARVLLILPSLALIWAVWQLTLVLMPLFNR